MVEIAIITAMTLFLLLGGTVWVSLSLLGAGALVLSIFKPNLPLQNLIGQITWSSTTSQELISLPLFILMGELLVRTRLGNSLFSGLSPWLGGLRGGLTHINVVGCTLFAAICGSSVATTQIVGRVTLPELEKRGYDMRLSIGSLAGAGTLGFLIPPSLIMIVYGVLAEQSIVALFMAGIVPGLGLAALYMFYIALVSKSTPGQKQPVDWTARRQGLRQLLPVVLLILGIIGSLYLGLAGPSEVAAVGVLGALCIAAAQGTFSRRVLIDAGRQTVRTSSMIGLILIGAAVISVAMSYVGLPKYIAQSIGALSLEPLALIAMLMVFYIVLGCILDGTSIIVLTLPIALPLVVTAGYDPIWFGIFLVIVVEMSQITPPVGFNLFVIQSITQCSLAYVTRAVLPFFVILMIWGMTLALFPEIALWLPNSLRN